MLLKSRFIEMFGNIATNPKNNNFYEIGKVFKYIKNGANIKQDKNSKGYPITRIETISSQVVNRDKMGYADIFDVSKYENYILQNNDILMSNINSTKHLGKCAIYTKLDKEIIIHGMNLLCLRPDDNFIISRYAWEYFQSSEFKHQIVLITKPAVNQASFTVTDLKK